MRHKRHLTKEELDYFMSDPWAKEHIIIDTTYYKPPSVAQPLPPKEDSTE